MGIHYALAKYRSGDGQGQEIPPGGYSTVKFQFAGEGSDPWEMHPRRQPDGYVVDDPATDDRAGYIWPSVDGLMTVQLEVEMQQGDFTATGTRFQVRPAEGQLENRGEEARLVPQGGDSDFYVRQYTMRARTGQPFTVQIAHNGQSPAFLTRMELSAVIVYELDEPAVRRLRVRKGTDPGENPGPRE